MQTINIGIHTVILLVGPSQSGKSTWARHFSQKIKSQDENLRVSILSSDSIRHELLGVEHHKYESAMLEASEAAFDLLTQKLQALTRYPINNEFVIIDTTGLDPQFRSTISDIAKSNHYRVAVVLFDYTLQTYFKGLDSHAKFIVGKHVEAFKQRVLPTIKRKSFDYSFTVKDKSPAFFEELNVVLIDHDIWKKSNFFTPSSKPLAMIGDIHESVAALEDLLVHLPQDCQLVFVGDLFDKGHDTRNMLELVEKLVDNGALMVVGNHESFIARRLRNQIEALSNEDELFSSVKVFQQDPLLAQRFLALFDKMLPYATFKNYGKTICVTHAPCHNNVIGKHSEKAQKAQRNFYFPKRDENSMCDELSFIELEAKSSHPLHIFGHVAHAMKHMQMKNKVWLDTGAVYGRLLSAFIVFPDGKNKIISRPSTKLSDTKLLVWKKIEKTENVDNKINSNYAVDTYEGLIRKYNLGPEDIYWLKTFAQSGAQFISGTMSPPRATQSQLEPIEEALLYYKRKKINHVILQPKWMGSRAQMYLHKDPSKDFVITRSGAKAGHQDIIIPLMQQMHELIDSKISYEEKIILDGELLPWSLLGKELIEKEFFQYGKSVEQELEILRNDNVFKQFNFPLDLEKEYQGVQTFLEMLKVYGSDSSPNYKPFSILSIDNQVWTDKNQFEVYCSLSNEPYCVLDLSNEECISKAQEFFSSLTETSIPYEGIVMKPLLTQTDTAAYIKVRNEKYLHLIYGHDYLLHYQEMCKNKKVGRKEALSIKQFELGVEMLKTNDQAQLMELACQMKFQINQEHELDPRL